MEVHRCIQVLSHIILNSHKTMEILTCLPRHQAAPPDTTLSQETTFLEGTNNLYNTTYFLQKAAEVVRTILRISEVKSDPNHGVTTPISSHDVSVLGLFVNIASE